MSQLTITRCGARLALLLVLAAAGTAGAQGITDRLELHGSLNAGYGRA